MALILCVALLVGVLPTMSFALTTLTNVAITGVSAPVANSLPDYDAEVDSSIYLDAGNNSAIYYKNGICWYDITNNFNVNVNAPFVAGHQYKAVFYVKANDGFNFANNVNVTVNGSAATVSYRFSDESIEVEYVFEAIPSATPVYSIEYYTDKHFETGDVLETVTLVRMNGTSDFGDILLEWDGSWYVNETKTNNYADYEKYTGNVYMPNVSYAYRAEITLEDGYEFAEEKYITFCTTRETISGTLCSLSNDKKTAVYFFFFDSLATTALTSVTYTLGGFETGKNINEITIGSTSPVITNGVYGSDYFITKSNRVPIMTGAFEVDTVYTLYIAVKSNSHDVSSLTKTDIKLGSMQATNTEIYNGTLYAIFFMPKLEASLTEIYSIHLVTDVVKPQAGAEFYYPEVFAVNGEQALASAIQKPIRDENFGWYVSDFFIPDAYSTYVKAPQKFENGKAYWFFGSLDVASGYKIADDCVVVVSTPEGLKEVSIYDEDEAYITIEFNYNLGAPTELPVAENARVSIAGYAQGKAIEDIKVTAAVNGKEMPFESADIPSEYGYFYAILDKDGKFIENGIFEYDTDYSLAVLFFEYKYDFSSIKAQDIAFANTHADKIEDRHGVYEATFKLPRLKKQIPNPFTDVKQGKFYYDSVLWAVENGITAGVTPTTFEPGSTCTRAQVVSFLWRAAGSPEPKSTNNPFTDVKTTAYYYKAVLWAVENGITAGVTPTTFEPNDDCTRGQIVAFLWRSQGSPKVKSVNPFGDVKAKAYYYDAVLWAVKYNITSGVSATSFAPKSPCTRGQIVSFLHRCLL